MAFWPEEQRLPAEARTIDVAPTAGDYAQASPTHEQPQQTGGGLFSWPPWRRGSDLEAGGEARAEEAAEGVCASLSWTERLLGFAVCFSCGLLVSVASFGSFTEMLLGRPARFALGQTLGNVLSLCSTAFLVGPVQQVKNMASRDRLIASIAYVVCMILTLVSVFEFHSAILTVVSVTVQWISLVWYTLSYIPYGRAAIMRMLSMAMNVL